MRQRPAWTFPARALPGNAAFVQRPIALLGGPLRLVGMAALLLLLLVAVALVAGSRPSNLLTPYGPAGNGRIAFTSANNIWTVDPVTGEGAGIIVGADEDWDPVWSRDGSQIAFIRHDPAADTTQLYVASPDGTGVRAVSAVMNWIWDHAFSPDGRSIAFTAGSEPDRGLWIADVAQGSARRVDLPMPVSSPTWVPGGTELVFTGSPVANQGDGLYAVDPVTGALRTILAPTPGTGRGAASVSPDGRYVAYSEADIPEAGANTYRVRVVGIDGSGDRLLPMPADATFQDGPVWSNDGTRLALVRGYGPRNEDVAVAMVPVDGSGTGVETPHSAAAGGSITGCCDTLLEWSPDDSVVLVLPEDKSGAMLPQVLVDPATGAVSPASWTAESIPAWQRVAP